MENLKLGTEWDKTFAKRDKVNHSKVTFVNRYGITLAADMYVPKDAAGKLPAIAVSGLFGAVKEQCSGLYAQTMAERGFLTIAFAPSFTGESGGQLRFFRLHLLGISPALLRLDAGLDIRDKMDKIVGWRLGFCSFWSVLLNGF